MHLIIEASDGDSDALFGDPAIYVDYLIEMTGKALMTPISEPIVKDVPEGRTAFLILAESHVSIHALYERNSAFVDLFTCKKMRQRQIFDVKNYTKEYFGFENIRCRVIDRGLETLNRGT